MKEKARVIAEVEAGLADAEAGRLLTSEEVEKELDRELGPLR